MMLNLSQSGVFDVAARTKYSNDGVDNPQLWTIWEKKLQTLNYGERIAFLSAYSCVTFVAVVGNLLTLYVVATR
jgi:hypothetical protein